MPDSPRGKFVRRFFVGLGLLFLLGGPLEIVSTFQFVPGFGEDFTRRIPLPIAMQQFVAALTPPMGALLLLWGVRGIGDLEVTGDGVRMPVSSILGILRGEPPVIRFEDVSEVRRVDWRGRFDVLELDTRRPDGRKQTRRIELDWAADKDGFIVKLGTRVRILDARGIRGSGAPN